MCYDSDNDDGTNKADKFEGMKCVCGVHVQRLCAEFVCGVCVRSSCAEDVCGGRVRRSCNAEPQLTLL